MLLNMPENSYLFLNICFVLIFRMFQQVYPLLFCQDFLATESFYKNRLGFNTLYFGNYLVVKREGISIMFSEPVQHHFNPSACFVLADNIEDLYLQYSRLGLIAPAGQLKEMPG